MKVSIRRWVGFLAAFLVAGDLSSPAWSASFESGQFLGFFTYTQVRVPLVQQSEKVARLLDSNPYLKGVTIRVTWKDEEPEPDHFDWTGVDRMIAIAHSHHVYFTLDPIAGIMTPDWVYSTGVKRFSSLDMNRHHPTYGQPRYTPVPWDATYHRLWQNFLAQLAARYGNDPSLLEVTVNGHNTVLEMMMPHSPEDLQHWNQLGWSPELVESDWKSWIDFFARTFPGTNIGLMLGPMYGESTKPVVERLAAYADNKYGRRLILMTAVLHGRGDQLHMFQTRIVIEHPQVLNAHETISTFADPQRQGAMPMFIYNMRQMSPLFVRLWRRDAMNVDECRQILAEYQHARSMSVADYRNELQSKGLYTAAGSNQGDSRGGRNQKGGFGRFGGRRGSGTYQGQEPYPEQGNPTRNSYPGGDALPE